LQSTLRTYQTLQIAATPAMIPTSNLQPRCPHAAVHPPTSRIAPLKVTRPSGSLLRKDEVGDTLTACEVPAELQPPGLMQTSTVQSNRWSNEAVNKWFSCRLAKTAPTPRQEGRPPGAGQKQPQAS